MGELSLLHEFRARAPQHPNIRVGPGSDCAVLTCTPGHEFTFKIDQIVEGTHFLLSSATPRQIGRKAMNKALSDLAAAGSWPVAAMVAVNIRRGSPDSLALELYEGLIECCQRFQFGLAGGDYTVSANGLSISVSLIGECLTGSAWTRAGGKPGDVLLVTGALGGSLAGKHLDFVPRLNEARSIRALAGSGIHACIDITDGLARDLHHLCDQSGCGATLRADDVPVSAAALATGNGLKCSLQDGEDFELLLAAAPEVAKALRAGDVPLIEIGQLTDRDAGRWLIHTNGAREPLPNLGYEHRST